MSMSVIIFSACNSPETVPDGSFVGEWDIEWQLNNDEGSFDSHQDPFLKGKASFDARGTAVIKAFGSPNSVFLQQTRTNSFEWSSTDNSLMLRNLDGGLETNYKIERISSKMAVLSFDDDLQLMMCRSDQ